MKTIVYVGTSLDGFLAREKGDIDWLSGFESDEVFRSYGEFMKTIDAFVIGRRTFEKVSTFASWPYQKMVYVLSTSLTGIPEGLRGKATILSMKPKDLLQYLSTQGLSTIYVDGGKVIQEFLREDCIDEMIVTKVPVLIGRGIPLFGYLSNDLLFDHIRTETYSNGLVKSHYRRIRT